MKQMREIQVSVEGGGVFISPLMEDGTPTPRGRLSADQINEFIDILKDAQEEAWTQDAMAKEIAAVRKKYGR